MKIGIVGGTGPQGKGLAYRFALAGHEIIVGSRSEERAGEAAAEIGERGANFLVRGATNEAAAREGDLVILSIPYEGQANALPALDEAAAGKTVAVTNVPLEFVDKQPVMIEVPEGSAAQQVQALLPRAKVVGAFQNLGASKLWKAADSLDQDVIVCSDDSQAKRQIMELAEQIRGVRAVDGGPLAAARHVEGLTVLLISINIRNKATTGVHIVGLT